MSGKRMWVCAGWVVLALGGMTPGFGADAGPGGGGPGGGGRGGGGRGGGGPGGGRGGRGGFMDNMFNRSLGIEQTAKVEDLPLGEVKRLVREVPVGGVDGLQENRQGWKVEEIFAMTPEQVQALTTLREEYKAELAKLQTEYDEAQKALAEKVKTLRLLYETKANDVLTDPAKTEKGKLDALAQEFAAQSEGKIKEQTAQVGELRTAMEEARQKNQNDQAHEIGQKLFTMVRTSMENRGTLAKDFNEKMKEAVTGAAKTKLEELLKPVANNRWQQWGGGNRGGGNHGGGGGGGGETQPPPKAPENF